MHALPNLDLGCLTSRHGRGELEDVRAHDREHVGSACDVLAVLDASFCDNAGGWRERSRIRQYRGGGSHAGLGGRELCFARRERLLCGAEVALGNRAGLEQLVGLVSVPLRGFEITLCGLAVSDSRRAIALLLAVFEFREQLALANVVAFARVHADEVSLESCTHYGFLDGSEVAGDLDAGFDRAAFDGFHVARGEDDRGRPPRTARSAGRAALRVGLTTTRSVAFCGGGCGRRGRSFTRTFGATRSNRDWWPG